MYLIQTVLCITALELVIPVEEGARKGQYKHKGSFAMKFLKIVLLFEPCAPGKVPSNRGLQGVCLCAGFSQHFDDRKGITRAQVRLEQQAELAAVSEVIL